MCIGNGGSCIGMHSVRGVRTGADSERSQVCSAGNEEPFGGGSNLYSTCPENLRLFKASEVHPEGRLCPYR